MPSSSTKADIDPHVRERLDEIWKKAYEVRSQAELVDLYRHWAQTYDEDHAAIGFFGHRSSARTLARYTPFPEVAKVLDAGAGTGHAGEALRALGFRDLSGLDISREMLDQAEQKGLYRHLVQADLGEPVDAFPCNHFDAAILVGVFSYGQAPAHALDEVVRMVRPGGVIAFTLRVDFFEQDEQGVRSRMEELEQTHAWKALELTEPEQYLPGKDPDAMFRVWCYRVLETKTPAVDEDFANAVRVAFTKPAKVRRLDHRFIWDTTASRLYDRYTECPGYYLTDAELEIIETNADKILDEAGLVLELGCGSAKKISPLLEAATRRAANGIVYTPIDVSQGAVEATQAAVEEQFAAQGVEVVPRVGRFDDVLASIPARDSKLIVFFGGSLGNFESVEKTVEFLETIRHRMNSRDRFVVGIDLHKDVEVFRAAYEAGPANRSFFLHMIRRMNRELGANFDLQAFRQDSPYEAEPPHRGLQTHCVQLRLVSERAQRVYLSAMHMEISLEEGDSIQVGTSRKFRREDVDALGRLAGLELRRQWLDGESRFSLNEFVRA